MDHAINALKEYIRASIKIARDNPEDREERKDLLAMVRAIHIMERRYYGKEITDISEISSEIK